LGISLYRKLRWRRYLIARLVKARFLVAPRDISIAAQPQAIVTFNSDIIVVFQRKSHIITLLDHYQPCGYRVMLIHAMSPQRLVPFKQSSIIPVRF